jgi:putative addiction module component (TIGR02574 family)
MPTTAEQLYREALSLPLEARADLIERLVATLAEEIPSEITRAQLDEVHRRIAQVESGEVALIPGDEHWRESAHFWLSTGLQLSSG